MREFGFALLLLSSACSPSLSRPSEEVVDRIESRLAKLTCPGRLDQWERHYFYSAKRVSGEWQYDHHRIEFDLRQAGFEEFKAGRHIDRQLPAIASMLDDRSYRVAFGYYDTTTDKLTVGTCGMNM